MYKVEDFCSKGRLDLLNLLAASFNVVYAGMLIQTWD